VIVVVMQNGSFDHLFGTFPGANGPTPTSPGFTQLDSSGRPVTPFLLTKLAPPDLKHGRRDFLKMVNAGLMDRFAAVNGSRAMGYYDNTIAGVDKLWAWAQQFALADNFFASVLGDAPTNQLYMVAASDNDFPFGVEPAFGPCAEKDSAAEPFSFGNLGDQLSAKGISWAWFAENYGKCNSYQENQNPFQYFTSTQGTPHIQDYSQFATQLDGGTFPSVAFVQPLDVHAMHPGAGRVNDAIDWLEELVNKVQSSSTWPNTVIIIVWDSSGGWYDHVPPPSVDGQGFGPRVPMLVISPLAKRNYISHTQFDHTSILKFIQQNWQLPSLNPRNDSPASGDLRDMLQ
jgi:phospholipase C